MLHPALFWVSYRRNRSVILPVKTANLVGLKEQIKWSHFCEWRMSIKSRMCEALACISGHGILPEHAWKRATVVQTRGISLSSLSQDPSATCPGVDSAVSLPPCRGGSGTLSPSPSPSPHFPVAGPGGNEKWWWRKNRRRKWSDSSAVQSWAKDTTRALEPSPSTCKNRRKNIQLMGLLSTTCVGIYMFVYLLPSWAPRTRWAPER